MTMTTTQTLVVLALGSFACFLIWANSPAGLAWANNRLCDRLITTNKVRLYGPSELAYYTAACAKVNRSAWLETYGSGED